MAFSPDGKRLAGCGLDTNHMVAVFDVKKKSKKAIYKEKGGPETFLEMAWITNDKFVMVGNKVLCEWTILKKPKRGKTLYPRKAALASNKKLDSKLLTCHVD